MELIFNLRRISRNLSLVRTLASGKVSQESARSRGAQLRHTYSPVRLQLGTWAVVLKNRRCGRGYSRTSSRFRWKPWYIRVQSVYSYQPRTRWKWSLTQMDEAVVNIYIIYICWVCIFLLLGSPYGSLTLVSISLITKYSGARLGIPFLIIS